MMSGTILFVFYYQPFQLHLLYQECQLDKLLHTGEEDSRSKGRRKGCVQFETSSDESFFLATSSSTASSPIASKSLGMPIAPGKPDSKMSFESISFDAASTSQVRLKDAYLGGLIEEQRGGPVASKKKKIQKTPTILRLEPGTTKENLLPKTVKLGCNNLHTEPVLQLTSQKGTEATWDRYLHISPDTSHFLEAVLSRKICGRQPGDPMGDLM